MSSWLPFVQADWLANRFIDTRADRLDGWPVGWVTDGQTNRLILTDRLTVCRRQQADWLTGWLPAASFCPQPVSYKVSPSISQAIKQPAGHRVCKDVFFVFFFLEQKAFIWILKPPRDQTFFSLWWSWFVFLFELTYHKMNSNSRRSNC